MANPYASMINTILRRVITLIVASIIIIGRVLFTISLIIFPGMPNIQVESFAVSHLNLSNSLITSNWDLHFSAQNPNKKITLYLEDIVAAIFYDSLSLSDTNVPLFLFIYKGNETTQKVGFASSGSYVEKWAFDAMNKEMDEKKSIGFNVRMVGSVWFWRTSMSYFCVYCGLFTVGVSLNDSSGNLLGGPRQCVLGM